MTGYILLSIWISKWIWIWILGGYGNGYGMVMRCLPVAVVVIGEMDCAVAGTDAELKSTHSL